MRELQLEQQWRAGGPGRYNCKEDWNALISLSVDIDDKECTVVSSNVA